MKLTLIFSLLISIATLLSATPDYDHYLKDVNYGNFRARQMTALYSMNDGERYTMLSADSTQIIAYSYRTGKPVATIFDTRNTRGCTITKIHNYEFDKIERRILINTERTPIYRRSFTTTYYIYDTQNNDFRPLSKSDEPQQMAMFSPNGRMVAFARGNNLFVHKLDYGTELQITTDGEVNKIINGTPDWVYEEEFGLNRCFDWSPDSRLLAWVRFDETAIPHFAFDTYNHPYDESFSYKYPKAGTTNSTVSVHVYDIDNRTTRQMDCGNGNDIYFPILRWSNANESLAIVRLNRDQTHLQLLSVNPRSGVATTLVDEQDKVYIDYQNYTSLSFLADNSFVALSERDGFRHAYLYEANGTIKRQLTSGKWDITDFYSYNEKDQSAYFQAAKNHPSQRQVCHVDRKGKITVLDSRPGTHSATFSTDNKYIVSQFHNTTTAPQVIVSDARGKRLRTIIDNKEIQSLFDSYNLPQKEFITLNINGNELSAWMVRPTDFDANKQYPLIMVQYSGPDSQEVLDRFRPDWEYYLAQNGYIVACVDSRGTGSKGHDFRTCTYWNLGKYETEDQVAAAQYFGSLAYIDADRMAIWGWSYGGFMAINCLTYGNGIFKAGIAIAPVTDWRLYNTAYTERFMSTPQQNDKGYDRANLIDRASQLQGALLLCHGTSDDNVHIQHSMLYCQALVEAEKQFEMQIYPNKNHSILGAKTRHHLYTRFVKFLKDNL